MRAAKSVSVSRGAGPTVFPSPTTTTPLCSPLTVIYSRISHDPEGRQAGVERQEQDCRQMATKLSAAGWC